MSLVELLGQSTQIVHLFPLLVSLPPTTSSRGVGPFFLGSICTVHHATVKLVFSLRVKLEYDVFFRTEEVLLVQVHE